LTDGIKHQHLQLSESDDDASSNQPLSRKRDSKLLHHDGIYDKPKGASNLKKKRKELSNQEMRQTIFD
jgi:hypothetical protein